VGYFVTEEVEDDLVLEDDLALEEEVVGTAELELLDVEL